MWKINVVVKNRGGDDSVQRIRYGMCVCMYVCERESMTQRIRKLMY